MERTPQVAPTYLDTVCCAASRFSWGASLLHTLCPCQKLLPLTPRQRGAAGGVNVKHGQGCSRASQARRRLLRRLPW